jgi:hypothetical protein
MTRNLAYILVCLFGIGTQAVAQETRVVAKLDQSAIRIGDQTKLHLTIYQQSGDQYVFPVLNDTLAGKVQIVSTGTADTLRDKNDPQRITVTKSLIITGFDAGTYTIPALEFKGKTGPLRTAEQRLVVQSVKVDTSKAIFDIKQPLAVSYTFTDWLKDNWQLVLFPLLGIVCITAAVDYWMNHRKKGPVKEVVIPGLPFHTIAMNQLNALKEKKLWQQELIKEYYSELSEVLREYLEKRYAVKTHEKTTEEIIAGLKNADLDEVHKTMLHQLLTLADLVKFAKEKPVATENERSIEDAMLFVSATRNNVSDRAAAATVGQGQSNAAGSSVNIDDQHKTLSGHSGNHTDKSGGAGV